MIVLGFTFWSGSHDSSAAIVRDGMLVAAAEEGRFTRRKHDGGVPVNAIDFCLRAAGVEMRDVDAIAYPDMPFRTGPHSQIAEMRRERLAEMIRGGHARSRSMLHKLALDVALRAGITRDAGMNPMVAEAFRVLAERYGALPPVKYYGHHLSHAAAAYLTSGFDEAAVATLDGRGGPLSGATWRARVVDRQARGGTIHELTRLVLSRLHQICRARRFRRGKADGSRALLPGVTGGRGSERNARYRGEPLVPIPGASERCAIGVPAARGR